MPSQVLKVKYKSTIITLASIRLLNSFTYLPIARTHRLILVHEFLRLLSNIEMSA